MKRGVFILVFLAGCGPKDYAECLAKMPPSEIDIGTVALNLAKEFRPALDVSAYDDAITRLAREVRDLAGDSDDPRIRIAAINSVLFGNDRFSYADKETLGQDNPGTIDSLLDNKKGQCLSLAVLYVAVAQRLGYEVAGVIVPGHAFGTYLTKDKLINLDPSLWGLSMKDKFYVKNYIGNGPGVKTGAYFRPLRNKDLAAQLLSETANKHITNGNFEKAFSYAQAAVNMDSLCAECWATLEVSSWYASHVVSNPELSNRIYDLGLYAAYRSDNLGFMPLEETNAWKDRDK